MTDAKPAAPTLEPFLGLMVDLFVVLDPQGRFVWLNPAWSPLVGDTADEMLGRPYVEFVHPDDRAQADTVFAQLMSHGSAQGFLCRMVTADGKWLWVEWNAQAAGEGHVYAVGRDVTEQRKHLEALSEQNRILQAAGEVAALGHWHLEPAADTVFWSDTVYRIHGRDPADYTPTLRDGIDAYHEDDRGMVEDVVAASLRTGSPFEFEARIVQPGGGIRNILSRGLCETAEDGTVSAIFGVFLDLTDMKRLEANLRHSERMASVGTLAAGVAHEINNPLTFIMGNLELLQEEIHELSGGSPAGRMREMVELVEEARKGSDRVRRIVSGLRTFSRTDAPQDEAVDPNEALRVSLNIARSELRHAATVIRDFAGLPLVRGDETRLVQVFVNILVNAGQAVSQTGRSDHVIRVHGGRDEQGWAVVAIEDDGPGISDEIRQTIFDPFFTTKQPGEGTGLGLPIVHGIVEEMGGVLQLETEPGVGTTVTVKLPPMPSDSLGASGETDDGDREGRVLVIDDEPAMVTLLSRALGRQHEVVTTNSAKDALEILRSDDFHVIVCDVMMPGMTGQGLYRALSVLRPEMLSRIVFVTGGISSPEVEAFIRDLPNHLIMKPIDLHALRALTAEMTATALR